MIVSGPRALSRGLVDHARFAALMLLFAARLDGLRPARYIDLAPACRGSHHTGGASMVVSEAGPRPLSRVLLELAASTEQRISLDTIVVALSDRSFGALMVLFAAPNLVPLPPGSSTVFGIPLLLIAVQLLAGMSRPWLPRLLRDRSVERDTFAAVTMRLVPYIERVERLARPRHWPAPRVLADRFVGLLALVMAILLVLPIPFGNWLPAVAVILISLALTERDGLWLAGGVLVAVAAFGVAAGVLGTIGYAALSVLSP